MATIFQRHCNDESLISHLDGELPFYRRASVRRHIEKCWQCRLRLSEIESQVMRATRAMADDGFPGADRIAAARLDFLSRADGIAADVFAGKGAARARGMRALAWAAACLLIVSVYPAWRITRREPTSLPGVTAPEAIARVEREEAAAARRPSRQQFRVVVRQLKPAPAERESRLEVWSEPDRDRYALRFSDSRGVLQHAVWQPEAGKQYVYRPASSPMVSALDRREARERWDAWLFRGDLTLEEFEKELIDWLEKRAWTPVSFASGLAVLMSRDGTTARVEQISGGLRLSARRTAGAATVEFTLDVDRKTYAPSLQSIRYESGGRVLEIVLYPEHGPNPAPVSFEPPASLIRSKPSPDAGKPQTPATAAAEPHSTSEGLLEVQIHHTLHRVRACIGEVVEVRRKAGGGFEVRGAVASGERKEQLVAALAPLAGPRLLVAIQSAEEMLRDIRPESVTVHQGGPAVAGERPRAGKSLARFFSGNAAEAADFADRTLSAGEQMMRDAQALRVLAETFGGRSDVEAGEARWLLDVMTYDHLKDLEAGVEAARRILRPLAGERQMPPAVASGSSAGHESDLLRIFRGCERLNGLLRNVMLDGAEGSVQSRLLDEIAEAFPALEAHLRGATERASAAQAGGRR